MIHRHQGNQSAALMGNSYNLITAESEPMVMYGGD